MNTDIAMALAFSSVPIALGYIYFRLRVKKYDLLEKLVESSSEEAMAAIKYIHMPESRMESTELKWSAFSLSLAIGISLILGFETFGNSPRLALLGILPLSVGVGFFVMSRISRLHGDS